MAEAVFLGEKKRLPFMLFDVAGKQIGHGVYYPIGGNVQVWMAPDYASWQFCSVAEALNIPEVNGFRWKESGET